MVDKIYQEIILSALRLDCENFDLLTEAVKEEMGDKFEIGNLRETLISMVEAGFVSAVDYDQNDQVWVSLKFELENIDTYWFKAN